MVFITLVLTKYILTENADFVFLKSINFIFVSLLVISITAAGYIINDIYDIEADLINKPKKMYIKTHFSIKTAWLFYSILSLGAIILACYFSTQISHYILFFGTPLLLFFYSKYLKKTPLLGNIVVSIASSMPIYIIYLFDASYLKNNTTYLIILSYMFFAFLTTFIREIIKDIEDVDGDLKIKAKTLPILIGRKRASIVAFFVSSIVLVFVFITLLFFKNELNFVSYGIVFIVFPQVYFMYKLWISESKKDFSKLSTYLKIIMLFGIASMLLLKTVQIPA